MQPSRVLGKYIPAVIVVILSYFLFFWKLGGTHLTNWDEAWYADISRTMAEKGNIFSPSWNGRLFLEKPPLGFWLTAVSYRAFGDNEFSARFISALAGAATVFLVFWFVRYRWGPGAAWASSLVLLSTPAYLWRVRTGDLDSLLTFFLIASVIAIVELKKNKNALFLCSIAIGLSFLTKGSIAFIFPALGFLYYLLRRKKEASLRTLKALAVGGFIALTWLLVAYAINGQIFLTQFFTQQGEKIGSPLTLLSNARLATLDYLKSGLKFWIIAAVPATVAMIWSWRKQTESFIALCALIFVIILSFLKVQSSWFLMPVYPLVAIAVSWSAYVYARKYMLVVISVFTVVALLQLWRFRSDYFVPDVSRDEALVALASARATKSSDVIYLTHYYYPTAVYYSRRTTYAVYSDHPSESWWILAKDQWSSIFQKERVFINTNTSDFSYLKGKFPEIRFQIIFQSGDKLLLRKV